MGRRCGAPKRQASAAGSGSSGRCGRRPVALADGQQGKERGGGLLREPHQGT